MRGSSDEWADVPGFVLGLTARVREARERIVRSPASAVVDNANAIAATLAMLAEFPGRKRPGEGVIRCEDVEGSDAEGCARRSSHRVPCTASRAPRPTPARGSAARRPGGGSSAGTPPDRWIERDRLRDERLVRDRGAVMRQTGFEPRERARGPVARGRARGLRRAHGARDRPDRALWRTRERRAPRRARRRHPGADHGRRPRRDRAGPRACLRAVPPRPCRSARARPRRAVPAALARGVSLRGAHDRPRDRPLGPAHGAALERGRAPRRMARLRPALGGRGPRGGHPHAEFGPRGVGRERTPIEETAIRKQILLAAGDV